MGVEEALRLHRAYVEKYDVLASVLSREARRVYYGLDKIVEELKSVRENPAHLISKGGEGIKDFYKLVGDLEKLSAPYKKQQKEITLTVREGYTAKFPYTSADIREKTGLNIVKISSYTRSLAKGRDYITRDHKRRFSEHGLAKLNSKARKKK